MRANAEDSVLVILVYSDQQRKKAEELVHAMVKRAVEMEGTVTVSWRWLNVLFLRGILGLTFFLIGRARRWPREEGLSPARGGRVHGRCYEEGMFFCVPPPPPLFPPLFLPYELCDEDTLASTRLVVCAFE